MTEQEMKNALRDCDKTIANEFEALRGAAYNVGKAGLDAAKSEQASAVSEASGAKIRNTLLPLLATVFGIFLFTTSWFLAIVLIVGGIFAAYKLHEKAAYDQYKVVQSYNSMVAGVQSQAEHLRQVINHNQKI